MVAAALGTVSGENLCMIMVAGRDVLALSRSAFYSKRGCRNPNSTDIASLCDITGASCKN